jgi:3-phenylpropionate/trans-cinnamate dioxygenase ferredoxin subunit
MGVRFRSPSVGWETASGMCQASIRELVRGDQVTEFHDAMTTDWIEPGETTTVDVDGTPVGIANVQGEFYAFSNICPHQATQLGGLPLQRNCLLTCPEHHSVYDVRSGQCVVPSDDGFASDLPVYETRVVEDVVQVALPR